MTWMQFNMESVKHIQKNVITLEKIIALRTVVNVFTQNNYII